MHAHPSNNIPTMQIYSFQEIQNKTHRTTDISLIMRRFWLLASISIKVIRNAACTVVGGAQTGGDGTDDRCMMAGRWRGMRSSSGSVTVPSSSAKSSTFVRPVGRRFWTRRRIRYNYVHRGLLATRR